MLEFTVFYQRDLGINYRNARFLTNQTANVVIDDTGKTLEQCVEEVFVIALKRLKHIGMNPSHVTVGSYKRVTFCHQGWNDINQRFQVNQEG